MGPIARKEKQLSRKKYVVKTKAFDHEDDFYYINFMDDITVFEDDELPTPTGILDKQGYELFKIPEKPVIGFLQRKRPR